MRTDSRRLGRTVLSIMTVLMTLFPVSAQGLEARYWFDSDTASIRTCNISPGRQSLVVAADRLQDKPVNRIYFQVRKTDGEWSAIYTDHFYPCKESDFEFSYSFDALSTVNKLDMANLNADVTSLNDGCHNICVFETNGKTIPFQALFLKKTYAYGDMMLMLSSTRDSVRIEAPVSGGGTTVNYVDVSALVPGIYPLKAILFNSSSRQVLATADAMTQIHPAGGNRVTEICYWLNDSVGHSKVIQVADGGIPLKYTSYLDVSDMSEPTSDYTMRIGDDGPEVTPNFNLCVGVRSNLGFRTDSVSYFRDNSKTENLKAVELRSGVQHDFGTLSTDTVLWAKFPVQSGDEIRFLPRWRSTGKFFDGSGLPIDTVNFNDAAPSVTLRSVTDGMYYAQLYDMDESIRDFSVKMSYLRGPSAVNPGTGQEYDYEGVLIDWRSAKDWNKVGQDIVLNKKDVRIEVLKSSSDYQPAVAEKTNICRIMEDNRLVFATDGYMEKITLCVPSGLGIPDVVSEEGTVEADSEHNVIVWEGLSNKVEMAVGKLRGVNDSDDSVISELLLEKAYVKLSGVDESMYSMESGADVPDDFEYTEFNRMRIWESGNNVGEYWLRDIDRVSFSDNSMIVAVNDTEYSHNIGGRLIVTYSLESYVGLENAADESAPAVRIADGNIVISHLPDFVGIYTVDGRTLFSRYVDEDTFTYPTESLATGIYIIKIGGSVTKMLIR